MNKDQQEPHKSDDLQQAQQELNAALIAATYQAVRSEIQIIQSEYMSGMKYALFGSAAIYVWLFSMGFDSVSGLFSYAWWIPLALSLFIALKGILAAKHIFNISEFIRTHYSHKFDDPDDCWELYVIRKRKKHSLFALGFLLLSLLFWIGLLGVNLIVPFLVITSAQVPV